MAEKMTEREQFYYGKGYNKAIEEAADLARKPNKMEVVAALFGKKLDEEFEVRAFSYIIKSKFTEFGLEERYFTSEWLLNGELLQMLLTGEAVITNE